MKTTYYIHNNAIVVWQAVQGHKTNNCVMDLFINHMYRVQCYTLALFIKFIKLFSFLLQLAFSFCLVGAIKYKQPKYFALMVNIFCKLNQHNYAYMYHYTSIHVYDNL